MFNHANQDVLSEVEASVNHLGRLVSRITVPKLSILSADTLAREDQFPIYVGMVRRGSRYADRAKTIAYGQRLERQLQFELRNFFRAAFHSFNESAARVRSNNPAIYSIHCDEIGDSISCLRRVAEDPDSTLNDMAAQYFRTYDLMCAVEQKVQDALQKERCVAARQAENALLAEMDELGVKDWRNIRRPARF